MHPGTAMITLSTSSTQKEGGGRGGGKQGGVQSLCQWAEVPGHPGLVTAVMQASNNPVVLMLTPTNIFVQEIKVITTLCCLVKVVFYMVVHRFIRGISMVKTFGRLNANCKRT